jgi:hypothetical protein
VRQTYGIRTNRRRCIVFPHVILSRIHTVDILAIKRRVVRARGLVIVVALSEDRLVVGKTPPTELVTAPERLPACHVVTPVVLLDRLGALWARLGVGL